MFSENRIDILHRWKTTATAQQQRHHKHQFNNNKLRIPQLVYRWPIQLFNWMQCSSVSSSRLHSQRKFTATNKCSCTFNWSAYNAYVQAHWRHFLIKWYRSSNHTGFCWKNENETTATTESTTHHVINNTNWNEKWIWNSTLSFFFLPFFLKFCVETKWKIDRFSDVERFEIACHFFQETIWDEIFCACVCRYFSAKVSHCVSVF